MTGIEIRDSGDGIWDDGEWLSWHWINTQIDLQENGPRSDEEIEQKFDEIDREPSPELLFRILAARDHYDQMSEKISPDWGPIGEAYVAGRFDVKLCGPHTQGHDGRFGDEVIEIKTISPHKRRAFVTVKRSGNFNVLAVVRATADCRMDVRFIRREKLPAGEGGRRIVVTWNTACRLGKEYPPRRQRQPYDALRAEVSASARESKPK